LSYARKILGNDYPQLITVYLVAVDDTRLEIQLSKPVEAAGERLTQLICQELISI
jgi:hypothetical protein